MKHTFKKRIAFFVLCFVLITSMLCTPILSVSAASDDTKKSVDDDEPAFVDW